MEVARKTRREKKDEEEEEERKHGPSCSLFSSSSSISLLSRLFGDAGPARTVQGAPRVRARRTAKHCIRATRARARHARRRRRPAAARGANQQAVVKCAPGPRAAHVVAKSASRSGHLNRRVQMMQ